MHLVDGPHHQVFQVGLGTKMVLSMLLGFVVLAWCERQPSGSRMPARASSRAGRGLAARLRSLCKLHLIMLCMAVAYVDVLSGLLHIVLDNPSFTTLPLLGAGAIGFQRHHHHPAGITIHHLANFLQAVSNGYRLVAGDTCDSSKGIDHLPTVKRCPGGRRDADSANRIA